MEGVLGIELLDRAYEMLMTYLVVEVVLNRREDTSEDEEAHEIPRETGDNRRKPKRKRFWIRQLYLEREEHGHYEQMMHMLELHDVETYRNFQRLSPEVFREVLARVGPMITKQDTFWRPALAPGLKLAVTLRYLGSGESYKSLAFGFRVATNTIASIIPEVCQAIVDTYMEEVIPCPSSPNEWKRIADGFYNRWNLPHCIGAIDGKHVAIRCPAHGGSLYYNYKSFHSIVLMAIVDAEYNFLYVDVGCNGAGSDGGVFELCSFRKGLEKGYLHLPLPDALPNSETVMPYFLVGDEAFPLKTWLMKPLPRRNLTKEQRIYNYRISRARRVVENAFGILSAKYRCLLTSLPQRPERVQQLVMACCCLHNLIRRSFPHHAGQAAELTSCPGNDPLPNMGPPLAGNRGTNEAKAQRLSLLEYFNSPAGSVAWQESSI